MKTFDTLYARNSNGKINQWNIKAYYTPPDGIVEIGEGIIGGALSTSYRKTKGKNIGKMNETTPFKQACKDAESRWNDKKKKGYKSLDDLGIMLHVDHFMFDGIDYNLDLLEDCIDKALPLMRTDANNQNKPMKCQPYHKDDGGVRISFPCLGQPKLDGVRVFAKWGKVKEGEGIFAVEVEKALLTSKEGLRYDLPHIQNSFTKDMFLNLKTMEYDIIYDGELYIHGMLLQDLRSAVVKANENTPKVQFWTFDLAIDGVKQGERIGMLNRNIEYSKGSGGCENIIMVATIQVDTDEAAQRYTDDWISQGFEGGIFRDPKATYQFGSRPKTIVKLKRTMEDEFPIIDVVPGEFADDQGMFVCRTKEGKDFKVNPNATHEERREFLTNKTNYIGKRLQIRFFGWTKDKIPFHIKQAVVRDYE